MSSHDHGHKSPDQSRQQNEDRPASANSTSRNNDQHAEETALQQSREASRTASPAVEEKKNYDHVVFEPVDPENFDTKSFFTNVDALSHRLHSESMKSFETDFDPDELNSMVSSVTVSMENFRNYTMHSQAQLERLREQIKELKDRMHRKIAQHPYDTKPGDRMSYEERELEAKIQHLNKELARASEELVRAQEVSATSEVSATEAAHAAELAAEEAKQIQAEYEARRNAEAEHRKKEEQRHAREEKEMQEKERQEEERRKAEETRKAKLRKDEAATPEWEKWPTFTYRVEQGEFDQGIGCIVRGDTNRFREHMVKCELVDPLTSDLHLSENEELVSNILNITGEETFENEAYIIVPHCTSRASAMNREPVIKAETSSGWVELKSHEVTLEGYKDVKFVQAELKSCTKLAVITRFKRDFLTFTKKGGSVRSSVDQRVVFTAERSCFRTKEHFVVQIQPVDSGTINEIRIKTEKGKELLATSAFMSTEWTATEFGAPIWVTLPVPPNPVKAKKAAAARAAKEAKMKNPHSHAEPPPDDEQKRKKEKQKSNRRAASNRGAVAEEEEVVVTKKPTKWYMGQYGTQEEDDSDVLFYTYKDLKGKWHVEENKIISQVRLDTVEFQMTDPHSIDKFIVLRMKTSAEPRDALELSKILEVRLNERTVNVVMKQRNDDPYQAAIEVVHHSKLEKTLEKLAKEGYTEGPDVSKDIVVKEGDHIGIGFRANIHNHDKDANLDLIFNSQLSQRITVELSEVDKYLQKSYHMYRGYVQILKKTPTVCMRVPKKEKDKKKSVAKKEESEEKVAEEEDKQQEEEEPQSYIEYEKELLAELQVNIPKEQDQLEPVSINKAPVILRNNDDVINEETLRFLAGELGGEWQTLAHYLNVKRMRIQAILRNNSEKNDDEAKYDMLLTWAKRVPKSLKKVDVLGLALKKSGRSDLTDELYYRDENFQKQRKGLDHAEYD